MEAVAVVVYSAVLVVPPSPVAEAVQVAQVRCQAVLESLVQVAVVVAQGIIQPPVEMVDQEW